MNLLRIASPIIFSMLLLAIPGASAADDNESSATRTMAEFMINLQHYASEADKVKLEKVAVEATTTADEKIIAQALLNFKHKAADTDKPKLKAITEDVTAPAAVKDLASILLSLNHHATDADAAKLKQITK
ncbi:hypothetical protein Ping_2003 [Psychromonas ingrahamii 37]|uniref:Uncharacterized protein n=1 Tax=Psychromonas ingrahamii (strain DSM 17664 / CCUG 51855 / 37) TaxID=357804 RepID=A1SWA2_PSYIN|nr:hypothetical protein [Psychromonas ingrahamii]ABM03767.1 hypothetical protein Ping_2003 [Psychromonas ingrahamii 37]